MCEDCDLLDARRKPRTKITTTLTTTKTRSYTVDWTLKFKPYLEETNSISKRWTMNLVKCEFGALYIQNFQYMRAISLNFTDHWMYVQSHLLMRLDLLNEIQWRSYFVWGESKLSQTNLNCGVFDSLYV